MIECAIFGGIILDKYMEIESFPKRGQDVLIRSDFNIAGGCSVNMAATFQNLGGRAHIVSYLGSDFYGREIMNYLISHDLSLKYIKRIEGESGYCIVLLEKDGERTFLTKKGAEDYFERGLLSGDESKICNVMITGYYLLSKHGEEITACLERIAKNGGLILFDPGPLFHIIDTGILNRVISISRVVTVNESEKKAIVNPMDKSKILVIKKGGKGGTVYCGEQSFGYRAKSAEVVDTTGAGDSFAAGLMFGLSAGMGIKEAVDVAVESAAKTVSLKGPHGFWRPSRRGK